MGSYNDLDEFVSRLREQIAQLPPNIDPQTTGINIGGDNHGNISTGGAFTVNVNHPPGGWSCYSSSELRGILARLRRARRDSVWSLIVNKQIATLITVIGIFFVVSSDRFLTAIGVDASPGPGWIIGFIALALILAASSAWASSVLRVEQRILQETGADIEAIRAILLARKRQRNGET